MSRQRMKLDHPALAKLLQRAYSGEKAAAFAYIGHARSLKDPAAKARTKTAGRLSLRDDPFHHAIGVLLDDAKWHVDCRKVPRQHLFRETGLLLVQIHGDQLESYLRMRLQVAQNIKQGVAILAAGKAHHHAVAILDHVEISNSGPDKSSQAFVQLVDVVLRPRRNHSYQGFRPF